MKALANRTKHVVIVDDTEWEDVASAMAVSSERRGLEAALLTPAPTLTLTPDPDPGPAVNPDSGPAMALLGSPLEQDVEALGELAVTERVETYCNQVIVFRPANQSFVSLGNTMEPSSVAVGTYMWHSVINRSEASGPGLRLDLRGGPDHT